MLGALGVVYGDIGTSPIYALRESFHAQHGFQPSPANVLGVLSLIFWALVLVICIKYLAFVLRADNGGEGGILALSSLVAESSAARAWGGRTVLALGLFGTALLYGDGMITPAISVLSAVEGLGEATPVFQPYVIPLTVAILVGLFWTQARGTEKVGRMFGPVTLAWFGCLASLGLWHIAREPLVLSCILPTHAIGFFLNHGWSAFLVLGSVFLVVTGGEALYADMGHFGKRPIRLTWFVLVLPALLLNYLGQGALVLRQPEAIANPFFRMIPQWGYYPMVVLATAATVIASQALISGAFSITMQAVQLGFLPRMKVEHTSSDERGQVYVGVVNWILMVACITLVLAFRSSSNLAAAYGVAVTCSMGITTTLFFYLCRHAWGWSWPRALGLCSIFWTVDLAFFGANLTKVPTGGWFPLVVGSSLFLLMKTWKQGRRLLGQEIAAHSVSLEKLVDERLEQASQRVPGTAVFMSGQPRVAPPALLANLHFNHTLHERVLIVTVIVSERSRVPAEERAEIKKIDDEIYTVKLTFGYMTEPNVPSILKTLRVHGQPLLGDEVTYFLGRETIVPTRDPEDKMALWRERLFAAMARNSLNATAFFNIPTDRVVEVGTRFEL
ncbi:MAG: potassium transporter Kup [Vulcanimicrobiota bacterium]